MPFRVFSCVMALLLLAVRVYAQVDDVQQATADAKQDAEDNISLLAWGAAGFACSFCAPLYALIANPEVPVERFLGKSPEYVKTYTVVYQQRAKNRRIQASVIGCGAASAVSLIMQPFLLQALEPYQNY